MTKKVKSHKVNDISIEGSVIGKKKISVVKDMSNFEEEPLKEAVWRLKIEHDDFLARADSKIDTAVFIKYLHFCIKRNEVINLSIRGRVRCLDGDQEVVARFGDRITRIKARDFAKYKNCAELMTYNFKSKKWEWKKYFSTVSYTKRVRVKVNTISGRSIICDKMHGFPIYEGRDITHGFKFRERVANDLSENDLLMLSTQHSLNSNSKFFDGYDLGFIVGCYLADGTICNNTVTLTNNDIGVKNRFEMIVNRQFNAKTRWYAKNGENSSSFQCWSKLLCRFLVGRGTFSGDKHLSEEDLLSSKDYKIGLLDGYFSCESEISKKTGYIGIMSKSERLRDDIAFLLLQFNYITTLSSRVLKSGDYKGNKYFKLTISASQTFKFRKEIMKTRSNGMTQYILNKDAELQRRLIDGFLLDRVESIRKLKNSSVFCVSIENGNFLLANGILSLNSGKSLSAMAIAMKISEITGVPFLPERHIKFSWEDYMNELNDTKDIPMHSVYVIDEKEETMGMGSYAEQVAQLNVQRICAKMCIHTISLVGDYTILSINSVYNLATRERDFEKFETRLILHNVENQEEIPLCSIVIPIKKVLCDTIINREVNPVGKVISGCILCHKFNNPKLCPDSTFLKRYEKAKDANIERVMKGGSASARQKLREDMAYKLLEDKLYATAHSKEEMKVLANKLLPRLTNRQFTMDEVEDIVVMTRIVKRDRLEKKEQLTNKSVSTLLDYTETEEKPDGRPRKADRKHNSE